MIKNKLLTRAGEKSGWSDALTADVGAAAKQSNMWLFSNQDDIKATVTAYEKWAKENGLEKPVKAGLFEGEVIDAKGVKNVKDLPTMPELMTKLAVAINMAGSLGIAKGIKLAKGNPRQVAYAIKQIDEKDLA